MAFELRPGGDFADEIRRIGCEQIDVAAAELSRSSDRHGGVHEARKALKRARSLLHLIQPGLSRRAFKKHNRRLRDAARSLSGAREWQAMLQTIASLQSHFGGDWNPGLTGSLRAVFAGRQQRGEMQLDQAAERAVGRLEQQRRRFARLELGARAMSLGQGIELTYANARAHFKNAYAIGDGTAFHEWRKDAQRHWRQMQLMVAAWPDAMAVRISRAQALSQCLGDDHDIHVLLGHLRAAGPNLASWRELETFYDGCIERQCALRLAARGHGRLLFAERPDAFRRRMIRYWRAASERLSHGAVLPKAASGGEAIVPMPVSTQKQEVPPPATEAQAGDGDGERSAPASAERS